MDPTSFTFALNDKTALLVGASGLVGGKLLQILLHSEQYKKVIVIGRKSLEITHPKFEEIIIDFEYLNDNYLFFKADDVFCCLGTTIKKAKTQSNFKKVDVDYVLEIARMAATAGAKNFLVVSSMGADSNSKIFYSRMKGIMEEKLREIGFDSLHIFRPSLLLGQRKEVRRGETAAAFLAKGLYFFLAGPLRKYQPIEAETVARGMYHAAQMNCQGVHVYRSDQINRISR